MATTSGVGLLGKIVLAAYAVVILAVGAIVGAYWWSNVPPSRPKGLMANSVWVWAPFVGLPGPKRGVWIGCSKEGRKGPCLCQITDKDGRTEYAGPFLSYKGSVPESDLAINAEETQAHRMEQGVFMNETLVPLVYLKNGDILIPEARYDHVKLLLDRSRQVR